MMTRSQAPRVVSLTQQRQADDVDGDHQAANDVHGAVGDLNLAGIDNSGESDILVQCTYVVEHIFWRRLTFVV